MSDAITCDGPDCQNAGVATFLGWLHLTVTGGSRRMDFCSLSCLGAFVMDNSSVFNEFEQALADMRADQPPTE